MTGHQCTGAKNLNMQKQSEQVQDVIQSSTKTGDIGCVENIVYTQNTKIYHVRTLSNGKLRRFNKHHLKVVQ